MLPFTTIDVKVLQANWTSVILDAVLKASEVSEETEEAILEACTPLLSAIEVKELTLEAIEEAWTPADFAKETFELLLEAALGSCKDKLDTLLITVAVFKLLLEAIEDA